MATRQIGLPTSNNHLDGFLSLFVKEELFMCPLNGLSLYLISRDSENQFFLKRYFDVYDKRIKGSLISYDIPIHKIP